MLEATGYQLNVLKESTSQEYEKKSCGHADGRSDGHVSKGKRILHVLVVGSSITILIIDKNRIQFKEIYSILYIFSYN